MEEPINVSAMSVSMSSRAYVEPELSDIDIQQTVGRQSSVNSLMSRLTDVASMAYGSGIGEGVKGGEGHIGVINGKVVKFNTKSAERKALNETSDTYRQMMEASDALRDRLATSISHIDEIVNQTSLFKNVDKDDLLQFKAKAAALLGLEQDHGVLVTDKNRSEDLSEAVSAFKGLENRGLLTRAAAAKTVTLIRDFLKQHVADRATLVRKGLTADEATLDLHVWGKVKDMKNLASTSADSSGYLKGVRRALHDVAAIKDTVLTVDNKTKTFAEHLRDCGNEVMKGDIASIRLDEMSDPGRTTLTMKGKTYAGLVPTHAYNMIRFQRVQTLAASLDTMLLRLHDLYNAKRGVDEKSPVEKPSILTGLGESPFRRLLNQALAKVLGKTEAEIRNLPDEERTLTENQNRNLMALVRNELLAVIAPRGNEIVPNSNPPKISEEAMLVKDFLMSATRLLDSDADGKNFSHVVLREESKQAHFDAKYETADIGKRLFTTDAYNVFTTFSYGVSDAQKAQLEREAEVKRSLQEALDGAKKDLFEPTGAFKAEGREEPVSITIVPHQARLAGELRLKKFVNQLRTVDPQNADDMARLRRTFIDEMQSLDNNAGVDTTRFEVKEGDETKILGYAAMVKKLLGDLFDQKLAPALLDPQVREMDDLPLI